MIKSPVFMGEFGARYNCFENGRGGDQYVIDFFEFIIKNKLNYAYCAYETPDGGLYYEENRKTKKNEVLEEIFKEYVKKT